MLANPTTAAAGDANSFAELMQMAVSRDRASKAVRALARYASSSKWSATCIVASSSTAEGDGIGQSAMAGSTPA